jgi:hypothetical protein
VEDSGIKDHWQTKSWNVSSAEAEPFKGKPAEALAGEISLADKADESVPSVGELATSWLPSKTFASVWLAFEPQKEHPITPLE